MATIKPIEARSIHQIQSGQVIVDLCSVVKELVENSLDAGATSVEVRFRNNGLDCIEVQDNGSGISPANFESLALKHHTSKLASYEDLSSLQTFGFRGEALSSLCALSSFHVITALADQAPKGKRIDFESSGSIRTITMVAAQKGTTAVVEGLFEQLPVRRKELTRNIKKEYGKVLGLLHAYACISTNIKFTVKSSVSKGKNATVFATRANQTTRENIVNVYGAKTLSALVPLELQLEFQRSLTQRGDADGPTMKILVRGHISRPVFGEGRQMPDRQMFFVNGRPCGLPQIAKAINEVYKSFNVSQSPFIFADFNMDTNAYDVNVSPDKRTIMLHDSIALVETLKSSLTQLFDRQDQTVPQSPFQSSRLPNYKQLTIASESTIQSADSGESEGAAMATRELLNQQGITENRILLDDFLNSKAKSTERPRLCDSENAESTSEARRINNMNEIANNSRGCDEYDEEAHLRNVDGGGNHKQFETAKDIHVRGFNLHIAEQEMKAADRPFVSKHATEQVDGPQIGANIPPLRGNAVHNAFDRIRPTRPAAEMATITVGNKTITTMVGSQPQAPDSTRKGEGAMCYKPHSDALVSTHAFTQRLKGFAAPLNSSVSIVEESNHRPASEDDTPELAGNMDHSMTANAFFVHSAEAYDNLSGDNDAGNDTMESTSSLDNETEGRYVDEIEKRAQEDATVAQLIRSAEEGAKHLSMHHPKRANRLLKGGWHRDLTTNLQATIATSVEQIRDSTSFRQYSPNNCKPTGAKLDKEDSAKGEESEEEHLALTVSKVDFLNMHIVGQFNLGFILAVRPSSSNNGDHSVTRNADELFIVDQHASDEKYNFEKLQAETVVGNQRLVRPKLLDLTAVEEEIVIENSFALEKNGFLVDVDGTEVGRIGQRCKLISLPLSKEVTFGLEDLEELLHLLAESPGLSQSSLVPRPSKVRKMFAMRACRSSVMIGKALTESRMRTLISHMGEIDKPWNCPHGRPTMRHLVSLNSSQTWQEGDGIAGKPETTREMDLWGRYALE